MRPRPKHDPLRAGRLAEHRRRSAELTEHKRRLFAALEASLLPAAPPEPDPPEDDDGDDWML